MPNFVPRYEPSYGLIRPNTEVIYMTPILGDMTCYAPYQVVCAQNVSSLGLDSQAVDIYDGRTLAKEPDSRLEWQGR